ncbi:hypothetical protein [Pseudomonas lactucae]|uniref:SMI1/KNR4 family protein n=1 Tax=Pseudomonas lactucae TaxID=2813360 RepID=A0A9X0YFU7_9PSED|nr:hypothetical protein [Pseudomonas lactucae]MBN2979108.1 hypothetical protein [Pseudomonas lactucae]MBN2988887.1 hypothetical protein [Pseudomonas lactucae]
MHLSFQSLAGDIGIELPERLATLLKISESHPETLESLEDFFWIDAEQAQREIDEWLNPDDQPRRVFMPFASSGGGEHYCWVRLEDRACGVAQILHFGQLTSLAYDDISTFVASEYVRVASNLSNLPLRADFGAALSAEVALIQAALRPQDYELLQALFAKPHTPMNYRAGSKSPEKTVEAFISQDEARQLIAKLRNPKPREFAALRDWMR